MTTLSGAESTRTMLRSNGSLLTVVLGWLILVGGGLGCTSGSSSPTQTEAATSATPSQQAEARSVSRGATTGSTRGESRTVAERLEDAALETRIRRALVDRKSLRVFDFRPDVQGGTVRLRGDVTTREQRRQAARIARGVEGVDTLVNEVTVQGRRPAVAGTTETEPGPDEPDNPSAVYYTVQSGDTLWNIAQDHRASISRIKDLNNLSASGSLQPGQRIRIR